MSAIDFKKITSDKCLSCQKPKPDNYNSYCDNCPTQYHSMRHCLGCGQAIGSRVTACDWCIREYPSKLIINQLIVRIEALEAWQQSVQALLAAEEFKRALE